MRHLLSLIIICTAAACKPFGASPINGTLSDQFHFDSIAFNSQMRVKRLLVQDSIRVADSLRIANAKSEDWWDIGIIDSTILLDIRYATDSNFVNDQLYDCPKCLLRPAVAKAIINIQNQLKKERLSLKLFDCYRPKPVQEKLWQKLPDARYVTNPKKGSMHNKGAAVDLTIVTKSGVELDMGTDFDFFGREAYHTTTDLPEEVLKNRSKLKSLMESNGFRSIRTEWWHYSFLAGNAFPISDYLWDCDN